MQTENAGSTSPPLASSVVVLETLDSVGAVLAPIRQQILAELRELPDSAAGLARRLAIPRQKVNYHLRELERHGLVELDEERPRRGFTERSLRPTADGYWIDPALLSSIVPRSDGAEDRFSATRLISLAVRTVRDVATLLRRSIRAGQRLPTLSIETEIHLNSSKELAQLQDRLAEVIAETTAEFHRPQGPRSRAYQVVLCSHPKITKKERERKNG